MKSWWQTIARKLASTFVKWDDSHHTNYGQIMYALNANCHSMLAVMECITVPHCGKLKTLLYMQRSFRHLKSIGLNTGQGKICSHLKTVADSLVTLSLPSQAWQRLSGALICVAFKALLQREVPSEAEKGTPQAASIALMDCEIKSREFHWSFILRSQWSSSLTPIAVSWSALIAVSPSTRRPMKWSSTIIFPDCESDEKMEPMNLEEDKFFSCPESNTFENLLQKLINKTGNLLSETV